VGEPLPLAACGVATLSVPGDPHLLENPLDVSEATIDYQANALRVLLLLVREEFLHAASPVRSGFGRLN
jgi:hypothetical protein